eukprot:gene7514-9235_t
MSSPLLSAMREDYRLNSLDETNILESPFKQFEKWLEDEIIWKKENEPNAMTLSTCSKEGKPSARIVLLKYFDEKGFVFFTNYNSRKSKEMTENPNVAITFYWNQRQVRIEGTVEKVSREESEGYFKTRPRQSQIGAWASEFQSSEVTKQKLIENQHHLEKQYEGKEVPTPPFWGGWRVNPVYFEFWQGKGGRVHDRLVFKKPKLDCNNINNSNGKHEGAGEEHHVKFKDLSIQENNTEHSSPSSSSSSSTTATPNSSPTPLEKISNTSSPPPPVNNWILKRLSP